MNINELKKQIRSEFEKKYQDGIDNHSPFSSEDVEAFLDKVIEKTWNEARREIRGQLEGALFYGEDNLEVLRNHIKNILSSQDKGE